MNHKIKKLVMISSIVTITGIITIELFANQNRRSKLQNPNKNDVDAIEAKSLIIEGWETTPWEGISYPGAPNGSIATNIVSGRPLNLGFNIKNQNSMGVKFEFAYLGSNKVELIPPGVVRKPLGQLDEQNRPRFINIRGVELPGEVQAISVWVMGRAKPYTMECWVQDWKNNVHVLKMGSLDFIGWRALNVKIPPWISQNIDSYPQDRTLIFRKFVIRAEKTAMQEEVILFFDSLKILTKLYDIYFDGLELNYDEEDKAKKDKISKYYRTLKNNHADKTN